MISKDIENKLREKLKEELEELKEAKEEENQIWCSVTASVARAEGQIRALQWVLKLLTSE